MTLLLHSKFGKLIPVLIIAGMMTTATASVYVFYYGNATATVQTPDIQLIAGSDASGSCTVYPCATVSVQNYTLATIGLSLFATGTGTPTPATYYTNLTVIKNAGTTTHAIKSVQIASISNSTDNVFGKITVYLCNTQTEFFANGSLATPTNCPASASIVSTTAPSFSGTVPSSLSSGGLVYIEVSGYANSQAATSSTIKFSIAVQWQ